MSHISKVSGAVLLWSGILYPDPFQGGQGRHCRHHSYIQPCRHAAKVKKKQRSPSVRVASHIGLGASVCASNPLNLFEVRLFPDPTHQLPRPCALPRYSLSTLDKIAYQLHT